MARNEEQWPPAHLPDSPPLQSQEPAAESILAEIQEKPMGALILDSI